VHLRAEVWQSCFCYSLDLSAPLLNWHTPKFPHVRVLSCRTLEWNFFCIRVFPFQGIAETLPLTTPPLVTSLHLSDHLRPCTNSYYCLRPPRRILIPHQFPYHLHSIFTLPAPVANLRHASPNVERKRKKPLRPLRRQHQAAQGHHTMMTNRKRCTKMSIWWTWM
jgi:hypothetical protein